MLKYELPPQAILFLKLRVSIANRSAMKSGIFSSLALVASLTLFGVASGYRRLNDKVHWSGLPKPAVEARDDVPLVEERTTSSYRFLNSATKRKMQCSNLFLTCADHFHSLPGYFSSPCTLRHWRDVLGIGAN